MHTVAEEGMGRGTASGVAVAPDELVAANMARQDQIVIGHRVAKTLRIPKGFLLRILVALSRARVLWSIKGPNGGYRLARRAKDITLLDVVEAVEGPIGGAMVDNFSISGRALDRRLEGVFEQATAVVRKQLSKIRITDLVPSWPAESGGTGSSAGWRRNERGRWTSSRLCKPGCKRFRCRSNGSPYGMRSINTLLNSRSC
jgi:Rrf2 family protein